MKRTALVLLAACGTPDPEIPQPDGPFVPGPVSIAITSHGQPAVNVPVIFQNADSAVVFSTVTDFDGTANAEIDGDSFVTVIEPREVSAPRDILTTFAGVQGGDELHLDLAPLGAIDVASFGLQIQQDLGTPPAFGHRVFTTCGLAEAFSFTMPEPVQLIGCGGSADMLVVTYDEFDQPLRSQFHPGVALSGMQSLTGTYEPFTDAMIEYRNIPGEVGFVGAYRGFGAGSRIVFDLTAGVVPDAAAGQAPIRVPAASGSIAITSSSTFPVDGEVGTQLVTDWEAASGGDYLLDLGAAMLPRYTEPPLFEVARRTATWVEAAGDTQPDAVRIRLQIFRPEIPVGIAWEWRLLGPRSGTSVTYPSLPVDEASGFDFNPRSIDIVSVHELTTAKLPGFDSKQIREHGFIPFKDMRSGTSGRIVTQDLFDREPTGEL